MNIVSTIVPVFIVIFIGLFARQRGFLSGEFINQANRLVYYFAIPAMVFSSIAGTDLQTQMNPTVILVSLGVVLVISGMAWGLARLLGVPDQSRGSFIQCGFHGNLGYIGFAIVFYYMGDQGLVKGAIIAGFVMILQNVLAMAVLQFYAGRSHAVSHMEIVKKAVGNPVILSAVAGIGFSLLGISIPIVIDRALEIIKGMALPLALLIIGASLSFRQFKSRLILLVVSSTVKLIAMPAVALVCFYLFSVNRAEYLPGLIILAAPTATLTYVLAKEIGGDPDLAGPAISFSTLLSALTYTFWLGLV